MDNEEEAIRAFTLKTGKTVTETGIWFDSSGILGAFPDCLIDEETVLEMKCPYTKRKLTIEEAVKSTTFCLEKCESEHGCTFKKGHVYWHQEQGAMYFSPRNFFFFFVVWT